MEVIFVYGQGAFWHAVFENGDEIGGFLEYESALNATYDKSLAEQRFKTIVPENTYPKNITLL